MRLRFLLKMPFQFNTVDFKGWWEGDNSDIPEAERKALQAQYPVKIKKNWFAKVPLLFSIAQNISIIKSCLWYKPTVVIHPGKGIGYVRIHKSGSSSIISSLFADELAHGKSLHAVEWSAYHHYLGQDHTQLGSIKYFTVVRNPFARLVSAYLNSYKDNTTHHFVYDCYLFGIFRRHYTFSEFVDCVAAIPARLLLDNVKPQAVVLAQSKIKDYKVFKLEGDQSELTEFMQMETGVFGVLNSSSAYEFKKYYNRTTLEKATKIYAADVAHFNYNNELDELRDYVNRQN